MNNETAESVISRSPDVMSGEAVFVGTRVPVQTLLDYLAAGHQLEDFLDDFPTVSREQVVEYQAETRRTKINRLFDTADRLAAIGEPISDAEVQAEVTAFRKEQK